MGANLETISIDKTFADGTEALKDISVEVEHGVFTVVTGESGSGKTTLAHCIGGIESVDDGQIIHGEHDITEFSDKKLTKWRSETVGYIFQTSSLINGFNAYRNIVWQHESHKRPIDREWGEEVCSKLGILDLLSKYPTQLSGGQRQRVAIARAVIHKPELVIADEPASALDTKNTEIVHEQLRSLVSELGMTVLMVSHHESAREFADKVVVMKDGEIVGKHRPQADQDVDFNMQQHF